NQTISPEQGASDLKMARQAEAAALKAAEDKALADAIDALRAEGQQPVEAQQPVQQPEQQPEQQAEYVPGDVQDADIQKLLTDNPRLLEALRAREWQTSQQVEAAQQQATQTVEAYRAQYEAAIANNAAAAAYSLIQSFPELQGVQPDQIPMAIQIVSKQSPERGAQMVRHIEEVRRLVEAHQQNQAQQVQAYQQAAQQDFQARAKDADASYYEFSKGFGDDYNKEIAKETLAMLQDFGMSEKEIGWHWQNNSMFRSFPAQRLMH